MQSQQKREKQKLPDGCQEVYKTRLKRWDKGSATGTLRPVKRKTTIATYRGRREVSAEKFIKEMSFIHVAG